MVKWGLAEAVVESISKNENISFFMAIPNQISNHRIA